MMTVKDPIICLLLTLFRVLLVVMMALFIFSGVATLLFDSISSSLCSRVILFLADNDNRLHTTSDDVALRLLRVETVTIRSST